MKSNSKRHLKQKVNDEGIEKDTTKEEIRKALGHATIRYKAIILLISSSGMASADVRALTYQEFLKSISEYVDIDAKTWIDIKELDQNSKEMIP